MKKLLLAGLIALFANASEIDLLKVATDGRVSGKSYVVAQNEAKNVKAGYSTMHSWILSYYGIRFILGYSSPVKPRIFYDN